MRVEMFELFEEDTNIASKSFRPTGKPLNEGEKWIVVNVYQRCREEAKSLGRPLSDAYERASYYAGVSRKVIVEIVAYFRKTGTVPPLVQAGNHTNHRTAIHSNALSRIREFIFERHRQGEACNARHINDLLSHEFGLTPHVSTTQRHLNQLGFEYRRTKPKTRSLREKPYVRQQRHTYLYQIQQRRDAGYHLVYVDESFLHHYHGQQFSWFSDSDFLERPSGKGRRWCFIHAISPNGLLPNCLLVFEAKKRTGDYHGSFNFEVFYEWFQHQLLPNLPERSCVVLDRATYHMVPEERVLPTQLKKAEIQQWLLKHAIQWEEHWLKPKLVETMEQQLDRTPFVQKVAQQHGHQLLFLPVHHPELNPIELLWALVKNDCAKKLRNGVSFKEVLNNLHEAFERISQETCQNLYAHIRKQEQEFWKIDLEFEDVDEEQNYLVEMK